MGNLVNIMGSYEVKDDVYFLSAKAPAKNDSDNNEIIEQESLPVEEVTSKLSHSTIEQENLPVESVSSSNKFSHYEYMSPEDMHTLYANCVHLIPNAEHYNYYDLKAMELYNLIRSCNVEKIYKFCHTIPSDELVKIINATPYDIYYGNVLHAVLYHIRGNIALELFNFFLESGAKICLNYYDELPWEQSGCLWTVLDNIHYRRNVDDFQEIYERASNFKKNSPILQQIAYLKQYRISNPMSIGN